MNLTVLIFSTVLFFVLSPGVLVTIPKNGSKITASAVHAVVFGIIFHFSHNFIMQLSEGFKEGSQIKRGKKGYCAKGNGKCA